MKQELERVRDSKKRMVAAIHKHGVRWVERVIEAGPARLVGSKPEDDFLAPADADEASEARQLFQWAMTYAGDRGGLPKQTSVEVGGQEGIPPIKVEIVGHARPSDT